MTDPTKPDTEDDALKDGFEDRTFAMTINGATTRPTS